ncbi:MAG: helix-turn-helix domain-containing protein [Ekhidna sp.]
MEITLPTVDEIRAVLKEELEQLRYTDERLMTREEAAEFLSISLPTLNDWTKSGKIKCHRIPDTGRVYYLRSELLDAVVECKVS